MSRGSSHSHGKSTQRLQALMGSLQDDPFQALPEGNFGRLFPHLPPLMPTDTELKELARAMVEQKSLEDRRDDGEAKNDNPTISAGYTYLGQFIVHDITFNPNSRLGRENDPNAFKNLRTPRLDLDSVYGLGPIDTPYLYSEDGDSLLIGRNEGGEDDLPRNSIDGKPHLALIGDPRNDENLILSQLHLVLLKFHNRIVKTLKSKGGASNGLFEDARQMMRWHYQWVVVTDFLKRIVGEGVIHEILKSEEYKISLSAGTKVAKVVKSDLKFFHWKTQPFLPVEFSVGAFRMGHSMVRGEYTLNGKAKEVPIFSDDSARNGKQRDLHGFRERPKNMQIEWKRFFELPDTDPEELEASRRIDTKLAPGLKNLPASILGEDKPEIDSLATRNLLRGKALGLPSGQAIARAMGIPDELILKGKQLGLPSSLEKVFEADTPLWYYILREAKHHCDGTMLGPVGGRIVGEVLIGLLAGDPLSYFNVEPGWHPVEGQFGAGRNGEFGMAELVSFATS